MKSIEIEITYIPQIISIEVEDKYISQGRVQSCYPSDIFRDYKDKITQEIANLPAPEKNWNIIEILK